MVHEMDPAQEFEAMILSRQKAMHEATARGDSAIQQFYRDAVVFVTGGSGFLGKQLIEKLLRATKVSKIFVLLRSKKGKAIQERLNEIVQEPVFDLLREQQPNFADKLVPIAGEVAELRLGIDEKEWQMLTEQVDIIFHMAATTRFDECLRVSTLINVRGAREALILGKACKKLKSYVHVSTAYSHACENLINTEVLEDFYRSPVDPETLIQLAEQVDEQRLKDITPSFIKNWPNTYSFAKAVAEETVRSLSEDMPVCIVRPAIVICSAREPSPGWLDISNVYGASGITLATGLGLMHVVKANDDIKIGLVPVDYVNNATIASAWETAKRYNAGESKPKIYTVTLSTRNPVLWGNLYKTSMRLVKTNYSTPAAVGPVRIIQTTNSFLFWFYSWLLHIIPAYFVDGLCTIFGKEKRFVKIYRKMYNLSVALAYFTVNDWRFVDDNTASLFDKMSTIDKEIFNFDVTNIDWAEYMILWGLGLRKYIIKDGLKSTKYAIKKQFFFEILTFVLLPLYFFVLYKIVCYAFLVVSFVFRLIF